MISTQVVAIMPPKDIKDHQHPDADDRKVKVDRGKQDVDEAAAPTISAIR